MNAFLLQLWQAISGGMMSWYDAKLFIEHASVVNSDGLHVLLGVLAWMLISLVLRRSLSASLPWLIVLAFTLLNEGVDLWMEQWPEKAMQLGESAKDVLLTMTLPVVLMLAIRLRPTLFRAPSSRRR